MPPLEEQRRIAEILDTIDETIHATERIIAKRKRIRSGLAASLLSGRSEGVPTEDWKTNETPPPLASKGVSRSWGMDDWATEDLGCFVRITTSQLTPTAFPNETFAYYSIPAFDATGGSIAQEGRNIESGKFSLERPAVLVSKLNPRKMRVQAFESSCGRRAVASTEFIVYEPRVDGVDLHHLKHLLSSNEFSQRLQAVATGTTNSHVRVRPSETLRWPVRMPPLEEQRRIAEILDTFDETVRANEQQRAKLRRLRSGLASDLLSGRVRTVAA